MKAFQRILAVLLCLVMSLGMISMVASATPITRSEGSLTIYKYEYNGAPGEAASGKNDASQVPNPDGTENDPKLLDDVVFELYQIVDDTALINYYNGKADKTLNDQLAELTGEGWKTNLSKYCVENEDGTYTVKALNGVQFNSPTYTMPATKNGVTNMAVALGLYIVVEKSAPERVTKKADPFLVAIPMTVNTEDAQGNVTSDWLYDVVVYPKNKTSVGSVSLKKLDENGSAMPGVKFTLEKDNDGTWVKQTRKVNEETFDYFVTDANGSIEWNNLAHGKYQVTETWAPDGYIVDVRPIEFVITKENKITCDDDRGAVSNDSFLTITLKNEKPDMDKVITKVENEAVSGGSVNETDVSVGDTVTYQVTIDVPENITSMRTFTLTDAPTHLNDTNSTIAITCPTAAEGKNTLGMGNNKQYTVSPEEDNGFEITFIPANMGDYAGKKIYLTYDAVVLADAADAIAAHNTATLSYSKKISTDSTTTDDTWKIEDGAVVYTYKLGVIKRKDSTTGETMDGVKFKLYDAKTGGNVIEVVGQNGVYRLATDDDTTTVDTLVTANGGKIVVKGMENGTYYLEEIATHDDYNLLTERVKVDLQISTETSWNESSEYVNGVLVKQTYKSATHTSDDNDDDTAELSNITIVNKKGFTLPQTGGIGTLMFIIIGGVLMAGGICLIVPNKKRAV